MREGAAYMSKSQDVKNEREADELCSLCHGTGEQVGPFGSMGACPACRGSGYENDDEVEVE